MLVGALVLLEYYTMSCIKISVRMFAIFACIVRNIVIDIFLTPHLFIFHLKFSVNIFFLRFSWWLSFQDKFSLLSLSFNYKLLILFSFFLTENPQFAHIFVFFTDFHKIMKIRNSTLSFSWVVFCCIVSILVFSSLYLICVMKLSYCLRESLSTLVLLFVLLWLFMEWLLTYC